MIYSSSFVFSKISRALLMYSRIVFHCFDLFIYTMRHFDIASSFGKHNSNKNWLRIQNICLVSRKCIVYLELVKYNLLKIR